MESNLQTAADPAKVVAVSGVMYLYDALNLVKLGKTKFYSEIKAGKIPKPKNYNGRSIWFQKDLIDYMHNELFR